MILMSLCDCTTKKQNREHKQVPQTTEKTRFTGTARPYKEIGIHKKCKQL